MTDSATPSVTVCIGTYNQAAYIEGCVLSVIGQAGDLDIEILVGDDCSTDNTAQLLACLLQRHPGRFKCVPRSSNLGPTKNYQDLVSRSRGQFIAHLDGDDLWLPGKLRAQVNFLRAHPECAAAYTNAIALDWQGQLLGPFTRSHPELITLGYLAARGNFLMLSSVLYRSTHRDVFLNLPDPMLDYSLHLNLALRGLLGFIDRPLAAYTVGAPTSMVRNAFPLVERLLWASLNSVAAHLTGDERRQCASHFAAEVFLGRILKKTKVTHISLRELARFAEASRAELLIRAAARATFIIAVGILRKGLNAGRLIRALAAHPRV